MDAIRKGLQSCSPRMQLVGASFWIAWVTIIYSAEPLFPGAKGTQEVTALSFVFSTFTLSVALLASSFIPNRVSAFLLSRRVMLPLSCLASLATLFILAGGLVPAALTVPCAVATGFVTCFIALRCGVLFSEIDTKNMLLTMCGSLILGVLIYSFAQMLTLYGMGVVSAVILLLCLPASVFFLWLNGPSDAEDPAVLEGERDRRRPKLLWKLAAYSLILLFMLCVIRGYYPNYIDSSQFAASRGVVGLGLILGGIGIALAIAAMPRNASFGTLCYALLLLSVFVSPLMAFLGVDATLIGNVSAVLFGLSVLCIWGLSCRISFCSGLPPVAVVGMAFGAACLGATMGFMVGEQMHAWSVSPETMAFLGAAALLLCALAAAALLRHKDIVALMEPADDAMPHEEKPSEASLAYAVPSFAGGALWAGLSSDGTAFADSVRKLCGYVALEYGLTPREVDVLVLLALGKDAKAVADELFISFNTVRSHIRRVYAKLDVHSHTELMALLGRFAQKLVTDESE